MTLSFYGLTKTLAGNPATRGDTMNIDNRSNTNLEENNTFINNKTCVSGRIVNEAVFSHEVYGEGFYVFKLEVSRLSNYADILPIMVSERLADIGNIRIGDNLQVFGQIRSYNNYVPSEQRNKLMLTIFAREISDDISSLQNPNEVFLNGYVCKPPTHRLTPFGREITDLLLAVNRSYNKSDYIPCIAWGRNSRYAGRLSVGDNIKVWGRMQSREYQKKLDDETKETRVAYEVSLSKIESCGTSPDAHSSTKSQL